MLSEDQIVFTVVDDKVLIRIAIRERRRRWLKMDLANLSASFVERQVKVNSHVWYY